MVDENMADNVDDANNGNNHLQTVMAACQVIIAVAVIVAGGYSIKIDALKLEEILQCSSDGSCADEYYYVSTRQIFLGIALFFTAIFATLVMMKCICFRR